MLNVAPLYILFPCSLQATICDQCTPQPPILVKNITVDKMSYVLFACLELDFFFFFVSSLLILNSMFRAVLSYNNIQNIWFSLCLNYHFSAFSHIFCAYRNMKDLFLLNRSGFLQDTSMYCSHQVSWELTQGVAGRNVWWLPRWRCTTVPLQMRYSTYHHSSNSTKLCIGYATYFPQ